MTTIGFRDLHTRGHVVLDCGTSSASEGDRDAGKRNGDSAIPAARTWKLPFRLPLTLR